MRGYPKFLNTKEDYEYVRANFPREEWEKDFKALLDMQQEWFFVKELGEGEIGVSDDTHKIEVSPSTSNPDGKAHSYQYELRYNPQCLMARLGYTEAEVKAILEE